ncbi:MAG TPA: heavy metal-responsive transcriptional regulator [Fimbriimonadaceae bacterium]|nr:heavy metal-responsive transcriptional regulator [Fimbriimonadaceae bacterium]
MKHLTIGQVAQRAGIGIETVRFYEREGLLNRPARSPSSGYRLYEEEVIARLLFIMRAKELGFTLSEIKELLSLRVDPGTCCEDVKARAEVKIAAIEEKIRTLRRMRKALLRLTRECGETGGGPDCPILEALDGHLLLIRKRPKP